MTASTVLTCSDEVLTSLATSPQLLACAVELAATPVSAEQGRELVRRLALLLRERPQLRPLVHELCVRLAPFSALGAGLREDQLLPLLHELVGKVQAMLVGGGEALNTSEHDELAMRCMESLQQIIASPPVSRQHTEKQLEVVQQLLAQCAASPQAPTAIAASSSAEVTLQRLLRHAANLDSTNSSKAPTPDPLRKATGGTAPAEHADASKA